MNRLLCFLFALNLFTGNIYAQVREASFINTQEVRLSKAYSHAVILDPASRLVKTSGIIGTNKEGELVVSNPKEQIRQTFKNIQSILQEAGATVDDIVEIQTFLTDTVYLRDYALERRDFFQSRTNPPVISKTYYAKALINPKAIVEIDVTAVVPHKDSSATIYVTATVVAKEGKEDLLKEELGKLIRPTMSEKGCLSYELFQSKDDRRVFTLHEKWISRDALDLHFKMPYMQPLRDRRNELIESSKVVVVDKLEF